MLQRYRAAAGLSQEELAERAGLSQRGMSDLERGKRRAPHPATVRRLAEALGLTETHRIALLGAARTPALSDVATETIATDRIVRNNLPLQLTSFIGRVQETAAIRRELAKTRLLTLTGPAGTGKTRLALAVASAVAEDFTHGTVFVDLAPVTDPTQVPHAIAHALGLREAGRKPLRDTLSDYLKDKHLLLVLDNLEHLLAAGSMIGEVLSASDWLKILATSRSVLRVYGERDVPVPPLELPPQ
jgi:transcriptional regulator with XRE-family HTH domain